MKLWKYAAMQVFEEKKLNKLVFYTDTQLNPEDISICLWHRKHLIKFSTIFDRIKFIMTFFCARRDRVQHKWILKNWDRSLTLSYWLFSGFLLLWVFLHSQNKLYWNRFRLSIMHSTGEMHLFCVCVAMQQRKKIKSHSWNVQWVHELF